ncbi:MAG: aldehyde dehydrogenase family protein [Planctomycetota bacterium]
MQLTGENFIDGAWIAGDGAPTVSENPWTGDAVLEVRSPLDRKARIRCWNAPLETRIEMLRRFAELLTERKDELTGLIRTEVGKPTWEATQEAGACIAKIELTIDALAERRSDVELSNGRITYAPLGTILVIGPFNFPAHLPNGQIAPALLAGNGVIFKPSELAPACGEFMVRTWIDAGVPPECLALVQGGGDVASDLLDIADGVCFTGAYDTAMRISQRLATAPHVVRMFELGGINPIVVGRVEDVDAAARLIVFSAFVTAGQRCTCARRLLLSPDAPPNLLERVVELSSKLTIGDPADDLFAGPLITPAAAERLLARFGELGDPLLKPERIGRSGLTPAIVESSRTTSEEWFGPLLKIERCVDFDHACHRSFAPYRLSASVLTDEATQWKHAQETMPSFGIFHHNAPTVGAAGRMPFGGHGHSGNGRPAGFFAIDACNVPIASLENPTITPPDLRLPSDA